MMMECGWFLEKLYDDPDKGDSSLQESLLFVV